MPNTFNAWAQERIQSPWFPLRRMVPIVVVAAMAFAFSLGEGESPAYVLVVASLPVLIGLVGVFVFRDRMRRRALRRYRIPGVD